MQGVNKGPIVHVAYVVVYMQRYSSHIRVPFMGRLSLVLTSPAASRANDCPSVIRRLLSICPGFRVNEEHFSNSILRFCGGMECFFCFCCYDCYIVRIMRTRSINKLFIVYFFNHLLHRQLFLHFCVPPIHAGTIYLSQDI